MAKTNGKKVTPSKSKSISELSAEAKKKATETVEEIKTETVEKLEEVKAEVVEKTEEIKAEVAEKKTAVKRAAAKKVEDVHIQYGGYDGKDILIADIVEKAKALSEVKSPKSVEVFVKPEEDTVYFVVDGKAGQFAI